MYTALRRKRSACVKPYATRTLASAPFTGFVHGRDLTFAGQLQNALARGRRGRVVEYDHRLHPLAFQLDEYAVDFGDGAQRHCAEAHAQLRRRPLRGSQIQGMRRVAGIPDNRETRRPGQQLTQQLQPLGTQLGVDRRYAGDVATRARQAGNEPGAHCVAAGRHDDGHCGRGRARRTGGRIAGSNDRRCAPTRRPARAAAADRLQQTGTRSGSCGRRHNPVRAALRPAPGLAPAHATAASRRPTAQCALCGPAVERPDGRRRPRRQMPLWASAVGKPSNSSSSHLVQGHPEILGLLQYFRNALALELGSFHRVYLRAPETRHRQGAGARMQAPAQDTHRLDPGGIGRFLGAGRGRNTRQGPLMKFMLDSSSLV